MLTLVVWAMYFRFFAKKLLVLRRGMKDGLWLRAKANGRVWKRIDEVPDGTAPPGVEIDGKKCKELAEMIDFVHGIIDKTIRRELNPAWRAQHTDGVAFVFATDQPISPTISG